MSGDPIRLLDDPATAGLLRGDLSTARAAQVQCLDHGAGLGALQAALGAQTGAIPAVAASGAGGSLAAKLLLGAALIGGAAWWVTARDETPAMDPGASTTPAATPAATPEPAAAPRSSAPTPAPAAAEPASAELAPAPEEEPRVDAPESHVEAAVQPRGTRTRGASSGEATPGSESPDDAVVREAKQIQAARRALGTDAARALSLTQSIAKEFPRGQLVEERLAIAIRALAKLGRMDEARLQAEVFLETYARGAHANAVRRAVALDD
jgi:hypothetical protein